MRSRRRPWMRNELMTTPYLAEYPMENRGRWKEIFGNGNPLHIEIGCGKGMFIVENARRFPEVNFLGIEKEATVIASALRFAREQGDFPNLLFAAVNADSMGYIFENGEAARLYLNFSDPWAGRKKWAKRRLTHRNFLEVYKQILNPREIFFKTDDRPFFEFSLAEFSASGFALDNITYDLHGSEFAAQNIATEYESFFAAQGKPICRVEARG